jgi:hypothetical protein
MRRVVWIFGTLAVLAGCAAAGGSSRASGPFLRPGPLGPDNGGVPRAPGRWSGAADPVAAAPGARMPAGLSNGRGRAPLPGARLAGIGAYRAVVVPLALGTGMPGLSEQVLSAGYFGAPGVAGTLGDALSRESGGAFRLTAQVLPVLVNPEPSFDQRAPSGAELETLIRRALESWGRESDLGAYDNDGPDGIPGSPDDDRTLDMVWVVLEAPHAFQPFTLAQGFEVASGGRRLRTGPVHVLPAPGAVLPDMRVPLDQALATLGLGPTERFFPAGYPRTVASLARARLGWLPVAPFAGEADAELADGQALLLPLSDLPVDAGFWLVERTREHVFTSRVALRPDRFYQVTDSVRWGRGAEQVLPLSYHQGMRGPTVLVRWDADAGAPRVHPGSAYAAAPGRTPGPAPRIDAPVRAASPEAPESYRWLKLGSDSVRVSVGGPPLTVP